jgi:drug/metabolite transporter (DMT)-like permease
VSGTIPLTWETARPLVPELALIAATIAYGATFKLVQDALDDVTPVGFILLRFGMGAIVLLPFAFRNGWRGPSTARESLRFKQFALAAVAFGVIGFAGYWFQNEGLERTTTSNSAFITGLFVVFTPLIEIAYTRRRPTLNVVIAVAFAVLGLFLLEGATLRLHPGDALTLAGAFFFGLWILVGSYLTQHFDPIALTAGQIVVLAVLAVPVVAISGLGHVTTQVLVAAAVTGVACSALAFSLQLWGLRFVEPSRAAVILEFEPVVAGIIGYWVGERLGITGYFGAVIIFAGIIVAESRAWRAARPT